MKRSKHTLSNYRLFTCDMGQLVPVGLQEALPGDTFQLSSSAMIRVSPLAAPVMHPVTVRLHHFFVPHRLVWNGWEDFITGGPDGRNASSPPVIGVPLDGSKKGTLWDYLGVPVINAVGSTPFSMSAMPLNGINLIWNEFYRDQDLSVERALTDDTMPNIAWGKDYFTAARPWTQKGPDITLPLGTQAPVKGIGVLVGSQASPNPGQMLETGNGGAHQAWAQAYAMSQQSPQSLGYIETSGTGAEPVIFADLTQAGQIDVNDFRRAFALQRYQEARARYGSRYTEYLRYLGVTPSDARLQRPEYLGGGSSRINFSEVLQTAGDVPIDASRESFGVGDLYGHGIAGLRHGRIRRFIEEHGYIHSFMSVRPKGIYMNGLHRTFLRKTKEDFYQRELEAIGQQEVLQAEIFADPTNQSGVFGYQDRYSEYKETPSLVAGEYRDILDYWHMGRELPAATALNDQFVKCVPTKRIHNVQTNNTLWCMVNNQVVARRLVKRSGASYIL
ncbi:MAG: major capsid protein [Microviridae sp.]|nr:MAG: major capsid protein [Microviridae sp.]